jgi:hypothetical protein
MAGDDPSAWDLFLPNGRNKKVGGCRYENSEKMLSFALLKQ